MCNLFLHHVNNYLQISRYFKIGLTYSISLSFLLLLDIQKLFRFFKFTTSSKIETLSEKKLGPGPLIEFSSRLKIQSQNPKKLF